VKPLKYRPFEIIEYVNEKTFRWRLPPYMKITSMVNVEYMRLFELSMFDGEENHQVLPTIEYFVTHTLNELKEDNNSTTKGMGKSQRMARDLAYWPQKEDSKEGKML
jgi:hypothetical protein